MKKFTILFIISVYLLFNIIIIMPTFAANVFNEGIYKASDFNISSQNLYSVQNISSTDSAYVIIFDSNQLQMQSTRLIPKSAKYNLVPLKPEYRVVVVGKGQVYIDVT
ncbi:hypothetical protein [Clostridium sp.]|uniref:hypothetical protein n=1 Tax=Clostridium sp. TaxID=1506 RepID=UPI002614177E|nr:hypothetical protein [Clostridium sp.]